MNSYELSRQIFDWGFENPEKITPTHIALYFFCIEHCNRLGWKEKFGLPTTMVKEAIGIKSYNTYIKTLNDLVEWGFITMIEKSKNQYSSNIIALSKFDKALNKALDKALIKHTSKQSESTVQSIDSINKQETSKQETKEQETNTGFDDYPSFDDFWILYDKKTEREKCEGKWKKLKQDEKEKIMQTLPKYIESTTDKAFRKNPSTYLNNKCWNDEIIIRQQPNQQSIFPQEKPFDPNRMMPAWELEAMLRAGKLNTNT